MNDRHRQTTSTFYPSPSTTDFYHLDTASHLPRYTPSAVFNFESDQPLFDFQADQYSQGPAQSSMHSDRSWFSNNGQLTPTSTTARAHHHRESSLSSLGSAGPASPYTANTSNPQVAGELYHEYNDYQSANAKPLTPIHTPSQEQFLAPHYTNFYHHSSNPFAMSHDAQRVKSELMPAPEFNNMGRPTLLSSVANNDSPSTPPLYEDDRQKTGEISQSDPFFDSSSQKNETVYRNTVPKLERTMTDIYSDELYNPNFTISAAPQASVPAPMVTVSPHNDIFSQRLQAANNQHLSASNAQLSTTIPPRDKSPFRQGSPLAPVANHNFPSQTPNLRFQTASQIREQQKAEADARALQQQIARSSPSSAPPTTISPKDVDLVYHETEEDRNAPLFPPSQAHHAPTYRQQSNHLRDATESNDSVSQQNFGSMATTRRESSSAYSGVSASQQNNFNFTPPSIPGGIRIPQQYPFIPQPRRQPSNLTSTSEDFPATLISMESSSSEYAPESSDNKKPVGTSADTGTYTCTYHGCPLRFDTPAKLQRHKREGHRNSNTVVSTDEIGMTSAANRNSQAGPHKCERINPSTGKPCNTIFSRPYDLTRHEDTIHNARKQKVHCPICTEEKTFSRNDALTRHMRVVHPQYADQSSRRRRGGS